MVEFDLVAALVAGFVATLVMTGMMTMSARAGMTDIPPMPLVMGSMMSGERSRAMTLGAMAHFVLMGTVVFGIGYGLAFAAFDNDSWWVGALIGVAHGLAVGLLFMPMMPAMHPRMTRVLANADRPGSPRTVGSDDHGRVEIVAPGLLGRQWGSMTPAGLMMGHGVYGVVLALVYSWVA